MDSPEITHLSLCSGYGGIDLGLRRCIPNLRTVAYAEIEAFACELLLARMERGQLDAAPIWTDLKRFPWEKFRGLVDILSGGYPCQPFSSAGKRLGGEDPRHLWPFISSGIRLLQPRICFFENVEGHITQGLHHVLSDLGGLGYRTTWGIFSASECGAPHQRKRVFIMADRDGKGLQGHGGLELLGLSRGRKAAEGRVATSGGSGSKGVLCPNQSKAMADAANERPEWSSITGSAGASIATSGRGDRLWPSRPGEEQFRWEPSRVVGDTAQLFCNGGDDNAGRDRSSTTRGSRKLCCKSRDADGAEKQCVSGIKTEPALGGDANGSASGMDYAKLCVSGDSRIDELRLLGNGVVPAVAERAFEILSARLA